VRERDYPPHDRIPLWVRVLKPGHAREERRLRALLYEHRAAIQARLEALSDRRPTGR